LIYDNANQPNQAQQELGHIASNNVAIVNYAIPSVAGGGNNFNKIKKYDSDKNKE